MATIKFKPRPSKNKGGTIQVIFSYGRNKLFRYSLKSKINNLKNWDGYHQKVKNVLTEPNRDASNAKINKVRKFLDAKYIELRDRGDVVIDNKLLAKEMDIYLGRLLEVQEEKSAMEFLEFFDWFIKHYSTHPSPTTGNPLSEGTLRTYKNSLRIFKDYHEEVEPLTFESINESFYTKFLLFMYEQEASSNYLGTQIKILKTVMQDGLDRNHHGNIEFKKRYFKKPSEEVFNIYLTEDELYKIFGLDFTEFKSKRINKDFLLTADKMERARDLFLIGAYTGLRISDFNRLTKEHLIEEKGKLYLRIFIKKGQEYKTFPLHEIVSAVLAKRNGKLPQSLPDNHINYAVKEIGRLAKIDAKVEKKITKGGKKISTLYSKHDLIFSHTARRSFCTNAYKAGMETIDIMAISGHKTEKVFYNYIKVSDIERAVKMGEHPFFTNTRLN